MAAMAAFHRGVEFDVQPKGAYAVQLRLTPQLLEALRRAEEAGQGASIRFGTTPQGSAISVGGSDFRFTALSEQSCDVLRLPARGAPAGGGASLLGAVRQKLIVARTLEGERERVRARGEEAERRGQERKAQLLDGKPAPAGSKAAPPKPTTTIRRVTPPPQHAPRGPTPPPQQLTASMLAAPTGRPPTHPATAAAAPPPAAPPAPPAKPMHKSASTGKLGLTSKASSGASLFAGSLQLAASSRVLQAARSGVGLRLMLIAILAERPMSLNAVKAVLGDAASKVKAYKVPKKDELERTIKAVAEFRTPGVYIVYPILLKELESLPAAAPAAPAGGRNRSRSTTPPEQRGASPSRQSGDAPAGAGAGARGSGGKQKKAAAAGAGAGAAGASAAPAPTTTAAAARKQPAGSKRGRFDWTDDDSDAEEQPAATQRPRTQSQQQQQPPQPQLQAQPQQAAAAPPRQKKAASEPVCGPATAAATSPPSVGGAPPAGGGGGGGSSGSAGAGAAAAAGGGGSTAGGAAGTRLTRRTSSSRGSDHADESWIEEHADRQPEGAAPITSKEEYRAREAAFNAKYDVYFALHQLIEAHKKDFEALDAAIRGAASEAERERHRSELERLHQKRCERAKRWDAAYRVLHQELAAAKSRMAEFVQRLQHQQAQGRAGRGGTPEALPAVRVK